MSIGMAIKLKRIGKRMKQKQLADAAAVSAKHLSQIETEAIGDFGVQVFRRLCLALDADANELLDLPRIHNG